MNVRELCRLLSATLHLPGVDRWAEQLDLTITERNKHAKAVVQDIEAQRREAR